MDELKTKAKTHSFYISLIYVGLGTVSLFAITIPTLMKNELISMVCSIMLLLTMPVSFLGFGILYGGGTDGRLIALVTQLFVFGTFWYLVYRYLLGRYAKRKVRTK